MIKLGLWVLAAVMVWTALHPSKYSQEHPTEFLEQTAFGRVVLANAQSAMVAGNTLVDRSTNPFQGVR